MNTQGINDCKGNTRYPAKILEYVYVQTHPPCTEIKTKRMNAHYPCTGAEGEPGYAPRNKQKKIYIFERSNESNQPLDSKAHR